MDKLNKFFLLSYADKIISIKALLFLLIFKTSLFLFPFGSIRKFVEYLSDLLPLRQSASMTAEKISQILVAVNKNLFGEKNCLPQALAAMLLLKQYGYPVNLGFGVFKGTYKGKRIDFEAHAWVESADKIIIGNDKDIEYFTPLS